MGRAGPPRAAEAGLGAGLGEAPCLQEEHPTPNPQGQAPPAGSAGRRREAVPQGASVGEGRHWRTAMQDVSFWP